MNTVKKLTHRCSTNLNFRPENISAHQLASPNFKQQPAVPQNAKNLLLRLTDAPGKPPSILSSLNQLLARYGLTEEDISIGLTGYGETKTYLAEIGLVSVAEGYYNLHIGGNTAVSRLNKIFRYNQPEAAILRELNTLLAAYKITRKPGEKFGDFALRKQLI